MNHDNEPMVLTTRDARGVITLTLNRPKAFNALSAQGPGLAALMPPPAQPEPPAPAEATVVIETAMLSTPVAEADSLRMLRAGSTVTPTGNRDGLFVEVADNFGTTGWVSVEDLN